MQQHKRGRLYDLTRRSRFLCRVVSEAQNVEHAALLVAHFREGRLDRGLAALPPGRIQDLDLADLPQLPQQRGDGAPHPLAVQFALQQPAQRQGQHAAQHMHRDLVVRPVVLRPDGDAVRVLHLPEGALDMVLRAIAAHQVGIAPVVVVGEDQRLAQQRPLQLLPGAPLEAVAHLGQALLLADLDAEQIPHVPRAQPAVDLLLRAPHGRLAAAADPARAPAAQAALQRPQVLAALGNLAQQRAALRIGQLGVPGHQHRALDAEHHAPEAAGAHARQPRPGQRGQLLGRSREQVGVLGGHQGADEVERALPHALQVLARVVALVEDQRDALGAVGDLAAAPGQLGGQASEHGRVRAVARTGAVQQGQAEVGGHQQRHAHDAQRLAALLAVAALGQLGALVEGVDVGEEVGGVEQQPAQVEVELADHGGDEVALDGGDGVQREAVHVLPEALAGQLAGLQAEQAGQHGAGEPVGEAGLGAGGEAAVEGGDEQVGADGRAGAALGGVTVDVFGELEPAGEGEQSGGGAEPQGDEDWFRLETAQPRHLKISATGGLNTVGTLFDTSDQQLATDDDGGSGTNFALEAEVPAGVYFVRVRAFGSGTGSYMIEEHGEALLGPPFYAETGRIYWADRSARMIRRANLDGTGVEDFITGLDLPIKLALDLDGGKIYWVVEGGGSRIQRANSDGTAVQDLIAGMGAIGGLVLDVVAKKMYWTSYHPVGKIQRANLDGTGVEDIITGLDRPIDLALDFGGGKIYWTIGWPTAQNRPGKIQRANLDGTATEDLITGLVLPVDIELATSADVGGLIPGDDHGNDLSTATRMGLNSSVDGVIETTGDEDWFRLETSEPRHVKVRTTGSLDTFGTLFDASRRQLSFDDDGGSGNNFALEADVPPGVYYVRVRAYSASATGSYKIEEHGEAAVPVPPVPEPGTIEIMAGTGTAGYTGDGGPATDAQLELPTGLALGTSGLYVADDHGLRRVDPSGLITTVVATGTVLKSTGHLALDEAGNLYIADFTSNVICRVDPQGDISTLEAGSIRTPEQLAMDALGNLYVADRGHHRVIRAFAIGPIEVDLGQPSIPDHHGNDAASATRLPLNSSLSGSIGPFRDEDWFRVETTAPRDLRARTTGGLDTVGALFGASGRLLTASDDGRTGTNFAIAAKVPAGVYYVRVRGFGSQTGSYTIEEHGEAALSARPVEEPGTISTVAGTGVEGFSGDGGPAVSAQLASPGGLAVDRAGNLYISDDANHRVRRVDVAGTITTVVGDGQQGYEGDGGPAISAKLNTPSGVAVDRAGNLYVAEHWNHSVRRVDPAGTITTVVDDLFRPVDVKVDQAGNLYIAHIEDPHVLRVDPTGRRTFVRWSRNSSKVPTGLAVDGAGNVYIADQFDHQVWRVDPAGRVTLVAGNGQQGASGDGGPAIAASLDAPLDVAVDGAGNLFIVGNHRVRKVTLSTGDTGVGSASTDREALEAFYDATGGPNWTNRTNWKTSAPLGQWHGVTTDADGRVTHVLLRRNNLTGRIPAEIGNLAKLKLLVFYHNSLTGPIPPELGRLADLRHLEIPSNGLRGPIPGELGNLASLESLYLRGNQLTGTIPAEIGELAKLENLDLSYNQLVGGVPGELGNLIDLTSLKLDSNRLTGALPASLTRLQQLDEIWFERNSGLCAPSESGFLEWLSSRINIGPICSP